MELELSPDLDRFVQDLVESDEFTCAGAVIQKALRRFKSEPERVAAILQEGIDDLDNGRSLDGETVMHELVVRYAPVESHGNAEAA